MFTYIILFIFGLLVGSFLNVVIYREVSEADKDGSKKSKKKPVKKEKSGQFNKLKKWLPRWMVGRSFCPHCKRKIPWYDNIPLLSFVLLGGKCRFCRKKISFQYPLVELLVGLQFVWIYWLLQQFSFFGRLEGFYSFALVCYWIYIFSSLLVIFFADLKAGIIPDTVVIPAIIISFLRLFESGRWQFLLAGLGAAGFFWLLWRLTKKKGIGFGDVKLGLLMGLFLGFPQTIIALFLAFLTGAFCAVILMLTGKKKFGQTMPFGPFLVIGTIIAKIWGLAVWNWYFGFIF